MTTQFETFIKANKIKMKSIPEPMQEKINIYQSIQAESEQITEQDRLSIEQRLKQLDDEIYDDLLNVFDHLLNNNQVKRKPKPYVLGDTIEVVGGNTKYLGSVFKVAEYYPGNASKKEPESVLLETNGQTSGRLLMATKNIKKTAKRANEDILKELYESGKKLDNLSKSYLQALGIAVDFSQWEIPVGKFHLYRKSILSLHFRLDKKV